uniref:Reverse transcriptase domain-containing protein n=1 Tax=Tanacetum cinerariifolium TaxID=118510 RepID=A0A6L2LUT0_TANCI|nr:reverse transcriptase domain-containing protein [Tanacetum cinerariifolium]
MLPVTQIDTFYNGLTLRHRDTINAGASGTFMKRLPEECYDLIENMTAHHNDWDTSAEQSESSSSINSSSDPKIVTLKAKMAKINKNLMRVLQVNQQVKAVTPSCENYGGPHSYTDCPATIGQTQNGASHGQNPPPAYQAPAYQASGYQALVHQPPIPQPQVVTTNEFTNFIKANNVILKNMQTNMTSLTNSNLELKNMFGQFIKMNTASSSGSRTLSVERETEVTKDTVPHTNNGSTKDVQPPVIQTEIPVQNSKPVLAPVNAPKPNQKPSIPYPSRLHDQKLRDKANDQKEKFFQIFQDLNFNISFADALILMPKFGPTIKTLLTNKEKLFELFRTLLNEHCSATSLLKKLPEKLGDPGKFLIPCDFSGMVECLALADLGASINLMPLLVCNKLSLPELSPMCMTLELADHSLSRLVRVAEDVFVKVGTRSFLKTGRALIDVFEGELTLRVGKERTELTSLIWLMRSIRKKFLVSPMDNDFLLEEVDAFLALKDDATSPEVDQSYFDPEGDILLVEAFLNDDPSLPPPNQGNYLP